MGRRALRAAEWAPPRATRVVWLLLHQLGLHGRRQLRGEVDVTRQVGLAFHRMRLTGKRVFEHKRREVRGRRLLAAGCKSHGPVDREACVVVLRRHGEELERGVLDVLLLTDAPEHVAVAGRECRDGPAALVALGQSTDERGAEVRHDDVYLRELGDTRRENLLRQRRIPVRHLERLRADELVLVSLVEDLVEAVVLLDALAVALWPAEHEYVAALRKHLEDPLAPVLSCLGEG